MSIFHRSRASAYWPRLEGPFLFTKSLPAIFLVKKSIQAGLVDLINSSNILSHLGIQNLCKGIQNLTFLHSLNVNFERYHQRIHRDIEFVHSCSQIGSEGFQNLSQILKKLTSLKTLHFSFEK